MKKIVFIGTGFHPIPPVKGAAVEIWIDEVAKRLTAYEPHVISPCHPSLPLLESSNGITYHRIHMGRIYNRLFKKITRLDPYSYEKRVADAVAEIDPHIAHIHNRYWCVPVIKKRSDANKIILHMHNNFELKCDSPVEVDILAGCSNYMKEFAAKRFSMPPNNCRVIKNGVDINKFKPIWLKQKERGEMRKQFHLEKNRVILHVGRISPEKGIDCLIKAFRLVNKQIPDTRLVIAGEIRRGARENCDREQYGRKILAMAESLGDKIIFTDIIAPAEIHNYYLLGDLFVSTPVKEEAFGMVFLEASASGLPIVAAGIGGIPEAVKDGYSGQLINDPYDYNKLAGVMISLLESPDTSKSMGEYGRMMVEKEYSWEKVAQEVEGLYDTL